MSILPQFCSSSSDGQSTMRSQRRFPAMHFPLLQRKSSGEHDSVNIDKRDQYPSIMLLIAYQHLTHKTVKKYHIWKFQKENAVDLENFWNSVQGVSVHTVDFKRVSSPSNDFQYLWVPSYSSRRQIIDHCLGTLNTIFPRFADCTWQSFVCEGRIWLNLKFYKKNSIYNNIFYLIIK